MEQLLSTFFIVQIYTIIISYTHQQWQYTTVTMHCTHNGLLFGVCFVNGVACQIWQCHNQGIILLYWPVSYFTFMLMHLLLETQLTKMRWILPYTGSYISCNNYLICKLAIAGCINCFKDATRPVERKTVFMPTCMQSSVHISCLY